MFVFGEGEYISLNIGLGKAEGKNWWCVLYPPLCFLNVRKEEKDSKSDRTNEKQEKIKLKSFFAELTE